MQFNHDNMNGVRLAEELVNMLDTDYWEMGALEELLARFFVRQAELDAAAEQGLRSWAGMLRSVFTAESEDVRCAVVNTLLDQGVRRVFLTAHDGMLPHMHFADPQDSVVERVRGMTAGGLAIFITEAGGARLGACACRLPAGLRRHQPRGPPRVLLRAVRQHGRGPPLPRPPGHATPCRLTLRVLPPIPSQVRMPARQVRVRRMDQSSRA